MTNNQGDCSCRIFRKTDLRLISNLLVLVTAYHFIVAPATVQAAGNNSANISQKQTLKISDVVSSTPTGIAVSTASSTPDDNQDNQPAPAPKPKFTSVPLGYKEISAYNVGDINQTDDSPCTAANGENICLALEVGLKRCAANFVPFGTTLEIEGYGQCMVTDRMSSRYGNHVDIAMKKTEKQTALQFGRKKLKINLIKLAEAL